MYSYGISHYFGIFVLASFPGIVFFIFIFKISFMENSFDEEQYCSLKDELREVEAQINVHSEKLMELLDQKKE